MAKEDDSAIDPRPAFVVGRPLSGLLDAQRYLSSIEYCLDLAHTSASRWSSSSFCVVSEAEN